MSIPLRSALEEVNACLEAIRREDERLWELYSGKTPADPGEFIRKGWPGRPLETDEKI